jgi:hypothetical protein
VWLEGADDITLDAQAFLRRILETASAHVTCALEVRRLECMAEPIQSRCILKRIRLTHTPTWRQIGIHRQWALPGDPEVPEVETPITLDQLREARLIGADPYMVMMDVAKGTPMEREVLKRSTMGMSPWVLSAWVIATNKKGN